MFLLLALYSGKVNFTTKGSAETKFSSHDAQLNIGSSSSSNSALGSFNLRACRTSVRNKFFILNKVLFALGFVVLQVPYDTCSHFSSGSFRIMLWINQWMTMVWKAIGIS